MVNRLCRKIFMSVCLLAWSNNGYAVTPESNVTLTQSFNELTKGLMATGKYLIGMEQEKHFCDAAFYDGIVLGAGGFFIGKALQSLFQEPVGTLAGLVGDAAWSFGAADFFAKDLGHEGIRQCIVAGKTNAYMHKLFFINISTQLILYYIHTQIKAHKVWYEKQQERQRLNQQETRLGAITRYSASARAPFQAPL